MWQIWNWNYKNKLVGHNDFNDTGFLILATMISITRIFRALLSLKTSLMVGKQYQRPKMGIYGRCHRGKKISSFKNSIVESHTANSRCVNIIAYIFPVVWSMIFIQFLTRKLISQLQVLCQQRIQTPIMFTLLAEDPSRSMLSGTHCLIVLAILRVICSLVLIISFQV